MLSQKNGRILQAMPWNDIKDKEIPKMTLQYI